MLEVGKPRTHTNAGAPGVPHRRLNTVTSVPSFAAVVDAQRISVAPACHAAKMSTTHASQRWTRSKASAHNRIHHPAHRAPLLHLPLHAPRIDPIEEFVRIGGELFGNVVLTEDVDAKSPFSVLLLVKSDELARRHRIGHLESHVADA